MMALQIVLHYLMLVVPFAMMLVFGVGVPALLVVSYAQFGVGVGIVFVAFITDILTMGGGVTFGMHLYYPDILLGLLAVVAGLRLAFATDFPQRNRAWLCFCLLVCLNLATGLLVYGSAAGVQVRDYFYFMVAATYGMSFPMTAARLRVVFNALAAVALFLVGLALYRWLVYFAPLTSLLPPGGEYNTDGSMRVIYSSPTLIVAQVLVAALCFLGAAPGFSVARFCAPLLFGVVVILQHRSVWLAALCGVFARLLCGQRERPVSRRQALLVVGMILLTALPLTFSDNLSWVGKQVGASAAHAVAGEGSVGERLRSWRAMVNNWYGAGARAIVIGQSFGTENTRYVEDSEGRMRRIDYYAHNNYVQTLYNTGLFGLLAFLLANGYVVRGLLRIHRDRRGGVEADVLLVLMIMQLAYYVPYDVDFLQGLLFGISLAYVAGREAAPREALLPGMTRKEYT